MILNRPQQPSHAVREGKPCCNRGPELCSVLLWLEKEIVPEQKGCESSKSSSAQVYTSTGSSLIPWFPHCSKESYTYDSLSATLQPTPWKEPPSYFVGHTRSVAKKQLPITKGRSNDPGVLMRERHDKAADSNEPKKQILSFFT